MLGSNGTVLSDITPRAGPETVYNFEVAGEHVYYVGTDGLLVHNLYLRTLVDRAITKSKKIVSAQRASIQKSARKWLNKGPANTHVYVARINGKIVYVGITKNDILLRHLQHRVAMPDIFLAQITKTALTRNQARAIEQALINGGGKNGNKLKNRIDSIRSGRDILPGALEWATDWLKNNI